MQSARNLMSVIPQVGTVEWIGVRPSREAPLREVGEVNVLASHGLEGDHYASVDGKRQASLIQAEHLDAVASMLGKEQIDPRDVRRNIVVRGINLLALKDQTFLVGEVKMTFGALCVPCPRMETNLGPGGFNLMRGHGGITARVLTNGVIRIGDKVSLAPL